MNAIGSIAIPLPREPFDAAREAANAWRGRCCNLFARSEAAVTETLLALAAVEGRGRSIKLPHLVGQRYDALACAIGPEGSFAEEGKLASNALSGFREHERLRTFLAHGVFTVTLDNKGRWHLIIHLLALRSGKEQRDLFVIAQDTAAEVLTRIERDGSRLRSQLGQIRKYLGGA